MKYVINSIIFVVILSFACTSKRYKQDKQFQETSSGLKYRVISKGEGLSPEKGDILTIHYIATIKDEEVVFDDTYKRNEPLTFRFGKGHVINGWEEGFGLMSEGGKYEFIVPPDLAYGNERFNQIPPSSTVKFEVELLEVNKSEKQFRNRLEDFTVTPDGLKYLIKESGSGTKISDRSYVKVHYIGYFEDGEIFDSSKKRDDPFEFFVGEGMVIRGWEIGMKKFREGDIATLWVPYELAYGERGRGIIPPKTNIMFDIEILKVKEPSIPEPFDISKQDTIETESGLKYLIAKQSFGEKPEKNDIAVVHYTGYLSNGEIFDSSVKRAQSFRFVISSGQVIPGFDEAVRIMSKGSKYRFIIPPELAYNEREVNNIPPFSTLIFDIELIDIIK